jgi:hypothetical protein
MAAGKAASIRVAKADRAVSLLRGEGRAAIPLPASSRAVRAAAIVAATREAVVAALDTAVLIIPPKRPTDAFT